MFDPRPVELRNRPGYADRVFNMEVNYEFSPKPPVPYLKIIGGTETLKPKHIYYAQVHGQMKVTRRKRAIFIMYTNKDCKHYIINRDPRFISSLRGNLRNFWIFHLKPALLNKVYYRRL